MCNNYTAAAAGKRRGNVIAWLGSACCLCPRAKMTSASSNRSLALSRTPKLPASAPTNIFDRTTAASSGLVSVPGAHPIVHSRCTRCYCDDRRRLFVNPHSHQPSSERSTRCSRRAHAGDGHHDGDGGRLEGAAVLIGGAEFNKFNLTVVEGDANVVCCE